MERHLVTVFGGAGFIGRHLVRRLAAADWIVRVAVRDPVAAGFLQPLGGTGQIVPREVDIGEPDQVAEMVQGSEAVVNLVGILYEHGKQSFQRIHVDGARNVAEAAQAAGVRRFVQLSALGADPDSPAKYGRTKAAGEQAVLAAMPGAVVLRPSVVFGPEDDFFNRFATLARLSPILPVFETRFQPVYVGDVADAAMCAIDDVALDGKTFELGGPRVIPFREVMEIVMRETARKRLLIPLPLAIAEIEAFFLEWLPEPPLTRDQVKLLGQDNVVTPGALTFEDLNITPTAVEAIVPSYLQQYRPPSKQRRHMF